MIVDSHHHIWRRADLPWLEGPMVPRIFGPYEPIRRDYGIAEYCRDAQSAGVTHSVYVQTNWAPSQAVEEVEWVEGVRRGNGWPHAIVGFLDLTREDAADTLARCMRASPVLRGVRQQLHWHENESYRFASRPALMRDETWRRNLRRVAENDLHFELQVFPAQFDLCHDLLREFPEMPFVLMHAGMLEDFTPGGRDFWREGMARLSEHPNLLVKLSGLGTFLRRDDHDHVEWIVGETVKLFGAQRCMFGSNFPIEKLWTDFSTLFRGITQAIDDLPRDEREFILSRTAADLYRLG
jgi:predicted TIM-barrel fold metal-dependent hydrolase